MKLVLFPCMYCKYVREIREEIIKESQREQEKERERERERERKKVERTSMGYPLQRMG